MKFSDFERRKRPAVSDRDGAAPEKPAEPPEPRDDEPAAAPGSSPEGDRPRRASEIASAAGAHPARAPETPEAPASPLEEPGEAVGRDLPTRNLFSAMPKRPAAENAGAEAPSPDAAAVPGADTAPGTAPWEKEHSSPTVPAADTARQGVLPPAQYSAPYAPGMRQAGGEDIVPAAPAAGEAEAGCHTPREIYGRAIRAIRTAAQSPETPAGPCAAELKPVAQEILACLGCEPMEAQALLALAARTTASQYLYGHSVNVSILSMHLGLALRWSAQDLAALGVTALLHDIRSGTRAAVGPAESLEKEEIRTHTREGGAVREHLLALQRTEEDVFAALSPVPGGRGDAQSLSRYAQIIAICDVYEALSHARPWRPPLIPHEAIKSLIRRPFPEFEPRLVKFFIERMSLFPPGSYVLLSTGEVACVEGVTAGLPTRPVVRIHVRADGSREERATLMDLGRTPVVHIVRAVDETQLKLKDKRLLLGFQADRWWTE